MCRALAEIFFGRGTAHRAEASCRFIIGFGRRGGSRRFAKFSEEALDALPQRVRVGSKRSVQLTEVSFELDVDEEFEVGTGDEALPLAAGKKVPQENGSFERFWDSPNNIIGRRDRFIPFGVAGSSCFTFGPIEHAAFGHARDGKRQVGIPRQEFRRVEGFQERCDEMLGRVVRRKQWIAAASCRAAE
jgi:hypothetical protein